MSEIDQFKSFVSKWFWAMLVLVCIVVIFFVSSCNVQKHSTSTKVNTDSISNESSHKNTETTNTAGSKSEDNYEAKTITYYNYDTVNRVHYVDSFVTLRKGRLTIQDTQVIHVNKTVFDTTHKEITIQTEKKEADKTVKVAPFRLALAIGGVLLVLCLGIWIAYKVKKKVPIV